ncbi:hypothetical protein Tco_1124551, partial [Tanacetum coccineum]
RLGQHQSTTAAPPVNGGQRWPPVVDHRWTIAGPPPNHRRTTAESPPDHRPTTGQWWLTASQQTGQVGSWVGSDRYARVFEFMAGHYGVPLVGAYAPPGYDEEQQQQE